ncbi:MAG TPA: TonB-dependent receptor, partial [Cyclobacteriaceae bacterium]|nr:TonB-dependent receptor [Cyclobacteriaceae bacterium]
MQRKLQYLLFVMVLFSIPWIGKAQSGLLVTGVVKDPRGETLPGVSVIIKGTAIGTTTDMDGKFSLQVEGPESVLSFSFVGYLTEEVKVGNQSSIAVSLTEDVSTLQEVIVVGYGEVKKSDLTGSVIAVKGSDLNKTATSSVDQLLQGKAAGLQVIAPSGEPGAGATIRIRGISSLNGSNSPLMVVDGFPWGDAGNLKQINPSDIESIEVLKDASSAAIYGSRGANGVILITTKKGKSSQPRITFDNMTTLSTMPMKLDVWRDPVQAASIDNEARINAGLAPLYVGGDYLGTYYPSVAELRGIDPNKPKWSTNTDWTKLVYRKPISQSYTLTASGGNDRTKYSVSGNYYKEEGLSIRNSYERYNGKVTLEQKLTDKITLGLNTLVTQTHKSGNGLSAGRNIIFPAYNADGSYFKISPLDYDNPMATASSVLNDTKTIDVLGTLYLTWQLTKDLQFKTQVSNKFGNSITDWYEPRNATYNGYQFNGFGSIDNWTGNDVLNENYFTYNKRFSDHSLNVVAGFTSQVTNVRTSRLEGHGFVNDNLQNQNLNAATTQIASNSLTKTVLESWIGRANYSFKDRYLLTLTARSDGSSKFGDNNKWAFFPSAGAAWKIHEENFMQSIPAVSEAKLRASYGLTGNQGITPYQTLDRLGSGKYYTGGAFQIGYGPGIYDWDGYNKIWSGVPNKSLKWETTTQFDVGVDLGFANNRITASVDYYYKHTVDLLRKNNMAPSSGYDKIWINDGVIDNKGIEVALNALILTGDVNWSVGGNFTRNRNEVVSMGTDSFLWNGSNIEMLRAPINAYVIGKPYNSFYGYKTDGIVQTLQEGQEAGLTGDMAKPGEIKYKDISGVDGKPDGKIDDYDRTVIGNPNPKFIYSFNTRLEYKGFDFTTQIYGVHGNDVFDFQKFSPSGQLQRWTPDNPTNKYPSVNSTRAYYGSDWFVTKGSYMRIQNAT